MKNDPPVASASTNAKARSYGDMQRLKSAVNARISSFLFASLASIDTWAKDVPYSIVVAQRTQRSIRVSLVCLMQAVYTWAG